MGVANRTEVRKFAGKLNEIILEYVRTLREFQDYQLKVIGYVRSDYILDRNIF